MLTLRSMFARLAVRPQAIYQPVQAFHVSGVDMRARKGTREKREKLKKKHKAEKLAKMARIAKVGVVRNKNANVDKHLAKDWKPVCKDDAFPGLYYRWTEFTTAQAIQFHKENHHPSMCDGLHAPLNVSIELNMIGEKPTRILNGFQKLVNIDHPFEHGQERPILVFAKDEEQLEKATKAGATTVGSSDLIRSALKGNVRFADYQYILAHPDIMPEILALRGLLKKKFPSAKAETLGTDLDFLVTKIINGLFIQAKRDEFQEDYGEINTTIGTLKMPDEHLLANFRSIMTMVNAQRPNRAGKFITRVHFTTPFSREKFKISPADFPFEDFDRPGTPVLLPSKIKKNKDAPQFIRTYQLFRSQRAPVVD